VTLRSRLTLALVLLTTIGLALFGVVTYRLYSQSQFDRLDDQLLAAVRPVTVSLHEQMGDEGYRPPGGGGPQPRPPAALPAYAELRTPDGDTTRFPDVDLDLRPRLPADLSNVVEPFTTGSETGSTRWRVLVSHEPNGNDIVVANPTTEVVRSLHRLVLIETAASVVLLAALATGSWLILRRSLSPLERMATTARSISAGDLSERVEETDARTEVGELGSAFNAMLDDLERAFAERDATEQRLRQFLADASHELRTPLTSIQGFAELFRLGAGTDVDLPVILRRIEQESGRMRVLVEELLLLARLDQTRPVEREPVDLAVLAADACTDAVAIGGRERPVTLASPDPVVVTGDPMLLRQAIANLVVNAVEHTPPGTALDVGVACENGDGVVVVRDHGTGLSPAALDHVFDRFWREDGARAGTGTGLGLAIVAAVAEEHGGTVTAANADDGGGAVFTLRLPIG
jgi:two-component system OmpR family sensor kinase